MSGLREPDGNSPMSRRHKHKTSNQVTRIYFVGYTPPEGRGRFGFCWKADLSPLMRAARYLKKKGTKGRIVYKWGTGRPHSGVIVVLRASVRVHKEALTQVGKREGISVSWSRSPSRYPRSGSGVMMRVQKWNWTTKSANCCICGVCTSVHRDQMKNEKCSRCARADPLEQLLRGAGYL